MKLLISHKSKNEFKYFLRKNKIDFLETIDNPRLDKRIADHPDLSLFVLDKDTIVVDKNVFYYYKENLPGVNIISGDEVGYRYPYDAIYNLVKFKSFYIHNDFTERKIEEMMDKNFYKFLKIKQGYTRCSSIVLNDSIITSDYGIYKSLKDKIDISLIEKEDIELDGFDSGFLGGTCGMIDKRTIVFNGNIKKLNSYDIINKQCNKEKIKIIYPKNCELLDTGSLIMIG
ncbi:MAG: hypothetical protein PUG67_04675 [Peptoniphilaceae bacterium]|nr:hypothetical protein [Peptoniphilaceae bacterium]MDY6018443.1 hypothetical protein [Anaerococcus sp.]